MIGMKRLLRRESRPCGECERIRNTECELCVTSKLECVFCIVLIGCKSCNSKPTRAHLCTLKSETSYLVDIMWVNAILPCLLKRNKFLPMWLRNLHLREWFSILFIPGHSCLTPSHFPGGSVLAQSLSLTLASPPKRRKYGVNTKIN